MDKCREAFEAKYRELHPNDKCTLMANGNYSGWIKQAHWWAWQSLQAEVEEKYKRISELEKSEFALAKVKQILNKRIKTKLLESIIVRELIDFLFSNKAQGDIKYPELCDGLFDLNGLFFIRMYGITYEFKNNSWVECNGIFTQEDLINIRYINKY
jgi:hypothetical protein